MALSEKCLEPFAGFAAQIGRRKANRAEAERQRLGANGGLRVRSVLGWWGVYGQSGLVIPGRAAFLSPRSPGCKGDGRLRQESCGAKGLERLFAFHSDCATAI